MSRLVREAPALTDTLDPAQRAIVKLLGMASHRVDHVSDTILMAGSRASILHWDWSFGVRT